eukprot:CAMPEP_0113650266 /NCGR_PEP_ID=MMETSP0017_2-20120614/26743_1 /TAXON_ID=2856 /ORGANISM="Cylindrotheca closterium" /LENGTH=129 /DNA_ID=CAMNT_0000562759 /DNA_START=87 /DNA_END=476 /DNA_ORIENTATION=+ /assembly_acc=CAM_ASM_000147
MAFALNLALASSSLTPYNNSVLRVVLVVLLVLPLGLICSIPGLRFLFEPRDDFALALVSSSPYNNSVLRAVLVVLLVFPLGLICSIPGLEERFELVPLLLLLRWEEDLSMALALNLALASSSPYNISAL